MDALSLLVGSALLVILIELTMWHFFKSKIEGILFPKEADTSAFGFFTLIRMRLLSILYAVFQIAVLSLSFWYLW